MKSNEPVAIKYLDKEALRRRNIDQYFKRQILLARKLDHPNIVQIKDILASTTKIFIIFELVEGGELFDMIVEKVCAFI